MTAIILPGLGADARMYPREHYRHLRDVLFLDWLPYAGETSLGQVAQTIIDHHRVTGADIVGGSSLGGMVALEIAKMTGISTVLLIGSATAPGYINPVLKRLSGLADFAPVRLFQVVAGAVNHHAHRELLAMFEDADSRFIRAMCSALFQWEGRGGFAGVVHQIHGRQDRVILPPREPATIIPDGGHLISMTHPAIVAGFIEQHRV